MNKEQVKVLQDLSSQLKRIKQGVKPELVMRDIKRLDLEVITFLLDSVKPKQNRRITNEK